jgi:predicted DNA-binding transcriptional regulator AlpA
MPNEDSNIKLIRKVELAKQLGCSIYTIDRWTRKGSFPQPIYTSPGAPARWRVTTIEAWLAKRSVARRKSSGWRGRVVSDD